MQFQNGLMNSIRRTFCVCWIHVACIGTFGVRQFLFVFFQNTDAKCMENHKIWWLNRVHTLWNFHTFVFVFTENEHSNRGSAWEIWYSFPFTIVVSRGDWSIDPNVNFAWKINGTSEQSIQVVWAWGTVQNSFGWFLPTPEYNMHFNHFERKNKKRNEYVFLLLFLLWIAKTND